MPRGVKGSGKDRRRTFTPRYSIDDQRVPDENGNPIPSTSSTSPLLSKEAAINKALREETRRLQEEKEMKMTQAQELQKVKAPLHDPHDKTLFSGPHKALVLFPPPESYKSQDQVEVVVDPRISIDLEKYQRQGIRRIYDRLTKPGSDERGFILADVMGLGKTIQAIAILWTFLRQSPEFSMVKLKNVPLVRKAIIVCPANLVNQWGEAIQKLLTPSEKVHTQMKLTIIDDRVKAKRKKELCSAFMNPKNKKQCLIISYDSFTNMTKDYQENDDVNNPLLPGPFSENTDGVIGLVICDEAHHIKNSETQKSEAITEFRVKMKLALTGTPLQNNLSEYYSLICYVHPSFKVPHKKKKFLEKFQQPIEKYIDDPSYIEGKRVLDILKKEVEPFFLRRTKNPFVSKHKTEYIVCVHPDMKKGSDLQMKLLNEFAKCYWDQYNQILNPPPLQVQPPCKKRRVNAKAPKPTIHVTPLAAITISKQLCAHPDLVEDKFEEWEQKGTPLFKNLNKTMKHSGVTEFDANLSAKVCFVLKLLRCLKSNRDTEKDRVVIVSYETRVLSLIEEALNQRKYSFVRYDGSIQNQKRQSDVKNFNDRGRTDQFIMTLSCKAGSCGISLVGANHLIMFDPDWNPANDEQAMSRIYREGQKKDCHIYRLLTTGSI